MKLVDANVLLYAVNEASPHHVRSRTWLDGALSGGASVGLAWMPLLAFVRISTRPGLFAHPLSTAEAMGAVDDWVAQPAARVLAPTARHASLLTELLSEVGTGGNLVSDVHLAALAIEHRAEVITFDADFARFPSVRWSRPPAVQL